MASTSSRCGREGPSRSVVAWRGFLIETLLCLVLIAMIVVIAVHAPANPLAGVSVVALVAAITRILWRAR
jgi:glycerol uptake facilitator-like aquaporin